MEILQSILSWFFSFPAFVMLPVILLILALLARMKFSAACLVALQIGAGFAGIFLIYDSFLTLLKPAIAALSSARGLALPVVDAGWPPLAAITWAGWIAPVTIPLVLGINLLLLVFKRTTTLYIDVWNLWHFAFLGALVLAFTHNAWLALLAVVVIALYTIAATQWSAPHVEREVGLRGVGVSPFSVAGFLPWAVAMNDLFDRVPGLRRWSWNPSATSSRAAQWGQPVVLGFLLGVLLGLLAGYDVRKTSSLAVQVAAIFFLLPVCGGLISQAMAPLSEALKVRLSGRWSDRPLVIAMDTGFLMTNASVMATGLVLMPIALVLSFVLPGNRVLPVGDLPNLISVFSLSVLIFKGNVVRAVLAALPILVGFLYVASALAPTITTLGAQSGLAGLTSGSVQVTAFTDGGNPIRYWLLELFTGQIWAWAIVPAGLSLTFWAWQRYRTNK